MMRYMDSVGEILNPFLTLLSLMWLFMFLEWLAMWFLVHVQKGYDASEILYDLENPAIVLAKGDDYIFRGIRR